MKSKGTKAQQIAKLERSIKKFGDHPSSGETIGPKRKVLNELKGEK